MVKAIFLVIILDAVFAMFLVGDRGVIVENGREVVIRVRGLAKSFGSHQIWDGLSLDVYRGEILAIVGGSGQGKSVLMRVITGLMTPEAGEVGAVRSERQDAVARRIGSRSRSAGASCSRTARCFHR